MRLICCAFFMLLVACGGKDEVGGQGNAPTLLPPQNQNPSDPLPRERGRENAGTQFQIVCESIDYMGIFMPNSVQGASTRVRDFIQKEPNESMSAPGILSIKDKIMKLVFFHGGRAVVTNFDLVAHKEIGKRKSFSTSSPGGSEVYQQQGFSKIRTVATAPNRLAFAVANGDGYDLRSTEEPHRKVERWNLGGSFGNLRWEPINQNESEVFADRLGGSMRQGWFRINGANELVQKEMAPSSLGGHQISLKRFDNERLVWLEWKSGRATIRFWNTTTGEVQNYKVEGKFGAGMALFKPRGQEKLVVLQSRAGIHFFRFETNALVLAYVLEYPDLVKDHIQKRFWPWNPGALYSVGDDSQLLTVLPITWGKLLFAVDEGKYFRQLGHFACVNPDFYAEDYGGSL